jgi:hypothetical protein
MLPNNLRQFREGIFHTRREFADLLGGVRGRTVAEHTVANWEMGRRGIRIYQNDIAAILVAIKPQKTECSCGLPSVIRKREIDLCAECALPLHGGQRPRPETSVTNHQEITAAIRAFLPYQVGA